MILPVTNGRESKMKNKKQHVSRREFLKAGAAISAGAVLSASSPIIQTIGRIATALLLTVALQTLCISCNTAREPLANPPAVSAQNSQNASDLINAAKEGHVQKVKELLKRGFDVNAEDNDGVTALFMASQNGHIEVAKALLDKGADVDAQLNNGTTALILASQEGHSKVVNTLLDKGADVNAKGDDGETALMWASESGHSEVVKILLAQQGVKVNIKNNDEGKTALDYADNDLIRGLLKAAGGKTGRGLMGLTEK